MKLYLVRHGESDGKEKGHRQGPDSSLSQVGIAQMESTASRLQNLGIDLIISSTWTRAKQSAEVISQKTGAKIEFSSLTHEKEQNPDLYYVPDSALLNQKYLKEAKENWINFDWKLEGRGESVREVFARAQEFREQLYHQYAHANINICLVSHGHFLRSFISSVVIGDDLDSEIFKKFYRSLYFTNASLTILDFSLGYPRFEALNQNFHE